MADMYSFLLRTLEIMRFHARCVMDDGKSVALNELWPDVPARSAA